MAPPQLIVRDPRPRDAEQIKQLLETLVDEWSANHDDRCGKTPELHPAPCYHPMPTVLDEALQAGEIVVRDSDQGSPEPPRIWRTD
jgi:hypothetical protein